MTKRVDMNDVDPTDSLEYMVDGAPFTGEIVEFAPTGELVELITVADGLPHGPSLSWYRNGQLRQEPCRRTVARLAPQRRPRRRVDVRRRREPVVEGRLERAR